MNIQEIIDCENDLFRRYGGSIPEANDELNDLQQKKIEAVRAEHGTAFIGKINYYGDDCKNLSTNTILTEYTGQRVYTFGANFVVPSADADLADMILKWNSEFPFDLKLVDRILDRVEYLGGLYLLWS